MTTKNMIILASVALILMYSALLYKVHTFVSRLDVPNHEPLIVIPIIPFARPDQDLPTYLQPRPVTPHIEPFTPEIARDDNPEIDQIVDQSNQLKFSGHLNESLALLDQGLLKYPRSDKLHTFKGGWYFDKGDFAMAEIYYRKAFEINPKETLYLMNVALCLSNQNKALEAAGIYQQVYNRRKDVWILLSLAETLWKFNNWTDHSFYLNEIIKMTRNQLDSGKQASINTFMALHYAFDAKDIRGIAASSSNATFKDVWSRGKSSSQRVDFPPKPPKPAGSKIVVGYVSYDFHLHAVGVQVMNMFQHHNKEKFEIIAYNANDGTKAPTNDWVANKIREGVSRWVDIGTMSAFQAAEQIYKDNVDILIDMGLFTAYARMDIFTLRPAPIQCAWLGLASTTGGYWMDYVIGDPVASPLQYEHAYSEKIAMMPHSYHIFDHKQTYPTLLPAFPRNEHGLPTDKFIFCNPANNIRQNPELFDHWLSIMNKVPNSVLVMKYFEEISAENLRNYARSKGLTVTNDVNTNRLFFQPGSDKHIQMKAMCDVYLDIHYYNGHSTSGDMLYAGVPLVTFPAETMAGRAAASFATSLVGPEVAKEMIADSWEDYEAKAVRFATDKALYARVRNIVESSRHTSPLYDIARFVRNMERLFTLMVDRHRKGLGPDHLLVEGDTS